MQTIRGSGYLLKVLQDGNKRTRFKRLIFLKWGLNISFPCYITNCHKFRSLETTYTLTTSQFPRVMSFAQLSEALFSVSQGCVITEYHISVSSRLPSFLELRLFFQTHVYVGKIQFLVLIGLRSLFSCWLSVKDHSQFLRTSLGSCLIIPFTVLPEDDHLLLQGQQENLSDLRRAPGFLVKASPD